MTLRLKSLLPVTVIAALACGTFLTSVQAAEPSDATVIAKVDGRDVPLSDVKEFIKMLPEPMNQSPLEQVFPMAQDKVVNGVIIDIKAEKANLEQDPKYLERLAFLKRQLLRTTYIEREMEKRVNDAKLKETYDKMKASYQGIEEVSAQHILVDGEAQAKEVIAKLDKGAKFQDLVKEYSKDKGMAEDGDLGYFTKAQMVPEFSDAAFALKKGTYTKTPVKTQFGYHVIKLNDRRKASAPSFEEVKDQLKMQMQQGEAEAMLKEYRAAAKIELFDMNGGPLPAKKAEPAKAGDAVQPAAGK